MTAASRDCTEITALNLRQGGRHLYDSILCPLIDFRNGALNVVQNIKHQRAVSGTHFIDNKVFVGVDRQLVVCDQVSCYSLAIVGREHLGGRVPQLSSVVVLDLIEPVFEGGVATAQDLVELRLVPDGIEVERFVGREDDSLL